jgi:hypothetical protein
VCVGVLNRMWVCVLDCMWVMCASLCVHICWFTPFEHPEPKCIHTHTHIHTHMAGSTSAHHSSLTYIHTYKHTYIHGRINLSPSFLSYIHTYIHTHIHTWQDQPQPIIPPLHTYIHTYIHTYTHTYMAGSTSAHHASLTKNSDRLVPEKDHLPRITPSESRQFILDSCTEQK